MLNDLLVEINDVACRVGHLSACDLEKLQGMSEHLSRIAIDELSLRSHPRGRRSKMRIDPSRIHQDPMSLNTQG